MKLHSQILLFLSLSTCLWGCAHNRPADYGATVADGIVTIRYAAYPKAFRNPMKGLREFFAPGVDSVRADYPYPYGSLIKEYMQWNMLEDSRTDGVDKIIAYSNHRWKGVEEQNIKVIPRVYLLWVEPWHGGKTKDPTNPDDMDGWHWPSDMVPEYASPYKQKPGEFGAMVEPKDSIKPISGGYFAPDFPDRVRRLVAKLGQAWDDDPRVAYVEMGIIGEWGEHHDPDISTYWPPHDEPVHVANRTWVPGIEKVLGDAFTEAFPHKKVMVRYAYEFKDYDFGIYWDSWAIEQEQVRGYEEMLKLGDRWKHAPIGGEITWAWGDLYLKGYRSFEDCVANDTTRAKVIEQIRNLHCNHLGGITWANFNDPVFACNADSIQQHLGYRFFLSECAYPAIIRTGETFSIRFKVQNTGSSPFYYDWPLEISLFDPTTFKKVWSAKLPDVCISQWMPGEAWSVDAKAYLNPAPIYDVAATLTAPLDSLDGRYILALSCLDPAGNLPSLRFANTNYLKGGYHPLGYVGVNTAIDDYLVDVSLFDDLQADKSLKYTLNK